LASIIEGAPLLALAQRYGPAVADNACAVALEIGVRFARFGLKSRLLVMWLWRLQGRRPSTRLAAALENVADCK
jgi:hypothetical protein